MVLDTVWLLLAYYVIQEGRSDTGEEKKCNHL